MKAPNPSTALARVLVDEAIRCGVTDVCLSPGSRSAPLALTVAERPELTVHVILDERSAAFFAIGIAKASGVPALLICTSGTAVANYLPAIHEARRAGVAMLILTADRPPELRGTGANQTTDQIKIFGDAVLSFVEMGAPEPLETSNMYWRSVAARAFATATGAHPGPVHLNVAFREPLVPTDDGGAFPFGLEGRANGAPWHRELRSPAGIPREVVERIEGAKRGLIVAGHLETGGSEVAELAEALGWPLVAEATSNARRAGQSIDHYDLILGSDRFTDSHIPDLVLSFGSVGLSKTLARLLGKAPQILVGASDTWLDAGRTAELRLSIPAGDFCSALGEAGIGSSVAEGWRESWSDAALTARGVIEEASTKSRLSEPQAARTLLAESPNGAHIIVGASMPIRDVDNFSAARQDVRLFANRGLNGIDGFISTALGIASSTGTSTYALCGDLTFLHDQGALLHAAQRGVDLTIVLVNNDGGGIFSFLPQAQFPEHFETVFGTPQAVDIALLCRAHGITHVSVDDRDGFTSCLAPAPGIRVVELRTDRAENVRLHEQLRSSVAAALGP